MVLIFTLLSVSLTTMQSRLIPQISRDTFLRELAAGTTALTALITLFSFSLVIVALWLAMRLVHQRSIGGAIGMRARALWHFRRVTLAMVLLYAVIVVLLPMPEALQSSQNMPLGQWILLLPLALSGLLVQVSAEELVFRGYLQSQLAARFRHPAVWLIVPSVLFGLLHLNTQSDPLYAACIVLWATLFGLAAADLTARSGTLGPAIALHLVNNFAAILLSAPEGALDGLALYTVPIDESDTDLLISQVPVEIAILFCAWLTARVALRR